MVSILRTAMRFLLCISLLFVVRLASADEPFLKPNDVIAIVGGEDMVVASELGYLEAAVQKALPNHQLRFRSLAWEGDTVFEQRRDLNYPTLETQLDKIGATVVIAQFGQSESLAGPDHVAEFSSAYAKLIERLRGTKGRRMVLVEPCEWRMSNYGYSPNERSRTLKLYRDAIAKLAGDRSSEMRFSEANRAILIFGNSGARDGMHLSLSLHRAFAGAIAEDMIAPVREPKPPITKFESDAEDLRGLVASKNRLWFNYARPQNWAFLAGDRTNQPSSRDHIDRNKRWFPEELEHFVPLIEAKEKEIWNFVAQPKP
jgi:hypothetical protein